MTNKILATVAFGFVVVLAGCSGTAPEASDIQSSQLKAPGKGGSDKGDPGKDVPPSKDPSGKDAPPAPDGSKGGTSDVPSKEPPTDPGKDPGKEPSDPGSAKCFGTVITATCQSDDAWKD